MTIAAPLKVIVASVDDTDRVLIAEDHDSARNALEHLLTWRGFSVTATADGREALKFLAAQDGPSIALLDWEMPGISGIEICRRLRDRDTDRYLYLIVITAREGEEDIAKAMAAGADDFIRKPFGVPELIARVRTARRTLKLERNLAARISELQQAQKVERPSLQLLPICMYCKKLRDDSGAWQDIEFFIGRHTGMEFTRGVCPACMEKMKADEQGKAPDKGS